MATAGTSGLGPLEALVELIADRVVQKMNRRDGPILLTVPAAAKLLGVSARTVYVMVRDGRLPHVDQGGRIRLRRTDVEQAIEANTFRG